MINSSHIKGLNGLRAIAAIILLLGHTTQNEFATWISWGGVNNWLPVCCAYIFFVISGFLAGIKPSGDVALPVYYKKKAKRILPLYYLYVFVVIGVFVLIGRDSEVINSNLWLYIIPFPNIPFTWTAGIVPLVHLWFIGSLLFFYIIYPLIERWSGDNLLKVSVIITLVWALAKWAIYIFIGKGCLYRFWGTLGIDCLFLGVVLGILVRDKNKWIEKVSTSNIVAVVAWILFLTSGLYGKYIPSACRVEYIAIITCLLILSQFPERPIVNLENKVCDWLGGISYEIYVFQIIVIILMFNLYTSFGLSLPAIIIYAAVTTVVILVAWGVNKLLRLVVK